MSLSSESYGKLNHRKCAHDRNHKIQPPNVRSSIARRPSKELCAEENPFVEQKKCKSSTDAIKKNERVVKCLH